MLVFLSLISCSFSLNIQVFTSIYTSITQVNILSASLVDLDHAETITNLLVTDLEIVLSGKSFDLAVDLTNSFFFQGLLSEYSENYGIVILSLNPLTFVPDTWKFCVHSQLEDQKNAITALITYLHWERVAIISAEDNYSLQLMANFQGLSEIELNFVEASNSPQESFDNLIGKTIKPDGLSQFVLIGSGQFAEMALQSLQNMMIYSRSGIIVASKGIWLQGFEKIMIVVESGLETSTSEDNYDINAILYFVNSVQQFTSSNGDYSAQGILQQVQTLTTNSFKSPNFSIVNTLNSENLIIGSISNGSVTLLQKIEFPSVSPSNEYPSIQVSMSFANPPGTPNADQIEYFQTGAIFAATLVQMTQSKLQNHILDVYYASCGSEFFILDYSYYCWSQSVSNIGVFYLTSQVHDVAVGEMEVFEALGIGIPHIGGLITDVDLSSESTYPLFTRVASTIANYAFFIDLLNAMNWQQFVILYTNSTSSLGVYQGILTVPRIVLLNDVNKRMIPAGYTSAMFAEYQANFQEIYDLGLRNIVLLGESPDILYMAEGLYDIGLRRGDVNILGVSYFSPYLNQLPETAFKDKVSEMLIGSIIATAEEWVGDYGEAIREEMFEAFGPPESYRCFAFDAMMLGINAVDFMLTQGELYEDPAKLNQAVRMQRFTGCSGTVSIKDGSNDRSLYLIGLYNLVYDNTTLQYSDQLIATYDDQSIIPFVWNNAIVWPLGGTAIPTDSRFDGLLCPFESRDIMQNDQGTAIFYVIMVAIVIYTCLLTLWIWRKWWKREMPMLQQLSKERFGDYLVQAVIVIDMFQLLAMGPDQYPIILGVSKLNDAFSVALTNLLTFTRSVFWIGVYVALGVVAFWIYLLIVIFGRVDEKTKLNFFKVSAYVGQTMMPIIGDALFLPIIGILALVFDCSNGTGASLSEAYIESDCYTQCWYGQHLIFALVSIAALLVYIPTSILCRPLWQELEQEVTIKTNTSFYMVKGIVQVSLIILNRAIKNTSPPLHGGLVAGVLLGFALFTARVKPHNYERANLWRLLSIMIACWSIFMATGYWIVNEYQYLWTFLYFFGWVLAIIFGLVLQKRRYPSLLYSEKAIPISDLFKFGLTNTLKIDQLRRSMSMMYSSEKYKVEQVEQVESPDSLVFKRVNGKTTTARIE